MNPWSPRLSESGQRPPYPRMPTGSRVDRTDQSPGLPWRIGAFYREGAESPCSAGSPRKWDCAWVFEGTNSWLSNDGQLRRNTDRRSHYRHCQLCLVVDLLVTANLIDWRNRWSPDSRPIRQCLKRGIGTS